MSSYLLKIEQNYMKFIHLVLKYNNISISYVLLARILAIGGHYVF